jgi:hypothetical protein
MSIKAEVDQADLRRIMGKLTPELLNKPLAEFFDKSAVAVQGKARPKAPFDSGNLRNEIRTEIDGATPPLWAKVGLLKADDGSDLWYKARAMEYGTGRQGDPAVSHKGGHWPPAGALNRWGARHGGIPGFLIARAIGRAGGLRARPYLRPGLAEAIPLIKGYLRTLGADIRARWERG